MNINQSTFCSAPWFQLRLDWDGKYRPCCLLKEKQSKFTGRTDYSIHDTTVDEWMSSEYSQYLRKELTTGTRLPECDSCWRSEDAKVQSLRQITNNTVTKNNGENLEKTWIGSYIKPLEKYQSYYLIVADVKLSNVCNFSCAMCNPQNSSKIYDRWNADQSSKFVLEQIPTHFADVVKNYQTMRGYQHLRSILDQPIRHLKVLGGEPLIDKTLFQILQDVPSEKKSQINLHFVTNGSQDLVLAAEKLSGYCSVSFGISLEGIGKIQDYTRNGSDWSIIESNVLSAKEKGITISIHHLLQALTILKLTELINWCNDNQLEISYGVLFEPDYLSIAVLPPKIRQIINDNITDNNVKKLINKLPIMPEKYSKFLEYIDWYEKDFAIKLKDICPEIYSG